MPTAMIDSLTPREREILILIAEGHSLAEIAQIISRSLKTVESHRLAIGRKLKASNRVELAKIAIASGLISLSPDGTNQATAGGDGETGVERSLELQWLEQINDAVFNTPGHRYINTLCQAVTTVLGTRFCAVCMPDPEAPAFSRFTVALAERGELLDPIWYHGPGTPAETVVKEGVCMIKDGVQEAYPGDELMKSLGIHSYVGVRLKNALDQSPGIIAVSHDHALDHVKTIKRVLRFFVPRTSAELARMDQEKQLRELEQKIQSDAAAPVTSDAAEVTAGRMDSQEAINRLQHLMSSYTGSQLLSELANTLCEVTGVRFAAICMRDDTEQEPVLVTLVASEQEHQGETMRYPIKGTPCKLVADRGHYGLERGLAIEFPDDQWVIDHGIEGYVGVRLDASNGEQLGAVWMVDDKPLTETEKLKDLLRLLAPRIAAEVENRAELDKLYERCEQLESRISQLATSDGSH